MHLFKRRRRAVLGVLASAAATAFFVLPASPAAAGTATVSNACSNSVTANFSQIDVTTSGNAPATVAPGQSFTLSNLNQQAAIPGTIFVAGYNLGLLVVGPNNIPANARSVIEGTNTTQGTQSTNTAGGTPPNGSVTVSTTITDPDGTPGSGDETATPAALSVSYDDQTWTAGSGTYEFREDTVPLGPDAGGLVINALIAGFLNVQFRCSPGTVTPPDPGTVTFIDPAPSFSTTQILVPEISIDDVTVTEGDAGQTPANFTVSLSSASAQQVTVDFATSDGTATAGVDYASNSGTVTFAPGDTSEPVTVQVNGDTDVEPDETFNVDLSNASGGGATITDNRGVGTIANDFDHADDEAALDVIVSGPTRSAAGDKTVVARVSNFGTAAIQVCNADISWDIEVNDVDTTGTVSPQNPGCTSVAPGDSARFRFRWTYGAGEVAPGAIVDYTATVAVAGDINPGNNTDTETRTAK